MHTPSNRSSHNGFSPHRMNFRKVARLRAAEGLPPRKRGAQPGNRNRLIHGRYSKPYILRRAEMNTVLRDSRTLIRALKNATKLRCLAMKREMPLTRHQPLHLLEGPTIAQRLAGEDGAGRASSPRSSPGRIAVALPIFSKTLHFAGSTVAARGTT